MTIVATLRQTAIPVGNARRVSTRTSKAPLRYTSAGNEPLKKIYLKRSKDEFEALEAERDRNDDQAIAASLMQVMHVDPVSNPVEVERSRPRMVPLAEALQLLAEAEADDTTSEHDIDSDDDDDDEVERSRPRMVTHAEALRLLAEAEADDVTSEHDIDSIDDDDDDDEVKVDQNPFAGSSILGDPALYEPLMQMLAGVMQ